MNLLTWFGRGARRLQGSGEAASLPELEQALARLRSEAAAPAGLEDRVLARCAVARAQRPERAWGWRRAVTGWAGLSSERRRLHLGLAVGTVCLVASLGLASRGAGWQRLAGDTPIGLAVSGSAAPAPQDVLAPGEAQPELPTLGLAAARREPATPIATGVRSGRGSLAAMRGARHRRAHGMARP